MAEQKKQGRRGRPVTAYKVPLMVRITQEAADKIADVPNKSVYIDELIKKSNFKKEGYDTEKRGETKKLRILRPDGTDHQ